MARPVLSVQKHTLTIDSTSTSPTDVTFIADTPPNVQLTKGGGTDLPSMVFGERFSIANHSDGPHNGVYEVVTVTTPNEDYLVESITGATGAATGEPADVNQNVSAMASLTGSPTTANCIPFVTTRVVVTGSSADEFAAYAARASFVAGSPNKIRVETTDTDLASREIVCEVTVVEFNPNEVNVYSAEAEFDENSDEEIVTAAFGGNVDPSKSWLYFTYSTSSTTEWWRRHTIRGRITESVPVSGDWDELTFDALENQGGTAGDTTVQWWVAEAINTAWTVDPVDIVIADLVDENTDTFAAVGKAKTFILGSYMGSTSTEADANADNTIDVTLTDSGGDTWDTVTATRSGTEGEITWSGFVVELLGGENVYRGKLTTTAVSPDPADHTSIGATVTEVDSMIHTAGSCGNLGSGSHTGFESIEVADAFCTWTFFSPTHIDCEHRTAGGESDGSVSWEVIEWEMGAARRVMVIS
jgi:hypothetical protein